MGCRCRLLPAAAALLGWLLIAPSSSHREVVAFASSAHEKSPQRCLSLRKQHVEDDDDNVELLSTIGTQQQRIYLLSLQWTDLDQDPSRFSKTVADIWRWKDAVLGDGRDFFVPKPKTIRALQSYLVQQKSGNGVCTECVVLSNCARFEILVVMSSDKEDPIPSISSLLVRQVRSYQKRRGFQLHMPIIDWPGMIDQEAAHHAYHPHRGGGGECDSSASLVCQEEESARDDLSKHWTVLSGPRNVCEHLCLVAAGMSLHHPRRADRQSSSVATPSFRPFSSRDAHILLQLKRTLDVADGCTVLSTLLRFAIQAGKAARNPDKVPALLELRRKYGETGNSKFDVEPPADVMRKVEQAVREDAIDPLIQECVDSFKAMEYATEIASFRQRAVSLMALDDDDDDAAELQYIQAQLHQPTLRLRKGEPVDEAKFMLNLSADLVMRRQNASAVTTTTTTTMS